MVCAVDLITGIFSDFGPLGAAIAAVITSAFLLARTWLQIRYKRQTDQDRLRAEQTEKAIDELLDIYKLQIDTLKQMIATNAADWREHDEQQRREIATLEAALTISETEANRFARIMISCSRCGPHVENPNITNPGTPSPTGPVNPT